MIYYGKQSIDQSDIDAVVDVLKSDLLTQGPIVDNFENNIKDYFGSKYACVVSNGTAALHLAGLALGWKPSDIIITSPLTFLATANSIIYTGATPDFVDINPDTYTISPDLLEKKIKYYKSRGVNVKAVIGVDFAGHPCDWKELRLLADRYDFKLINDNCHALGAAYNGDKSYAIKYADIVTQSYHPVKHITTGEGGSILTNDEDLYNQIISLRTHGITKSKDKLDKNDGPWYYEMHHIGYNYRITDFQCALGINQLKKLDMFVGLRRKIAKIYDDRISILDKVKIPFVEPLFYHSYHLYPLQIFFDEIDITKAEFFNKMKQSGISLQVHYIPIHFQPYYQKNYGFKVGDFPASERFYANELSLPIYPTLDENDINNVISNTIKFLNL